MLPLETQILTRLFLTVAQIMLVLAVSSLYTGQYALNMPYVYSFP